MSAIRKVPTIQSVQPTIKPKQHSLISSPVKTLSTKAQSIYQQVTESLTANQPTVVVSTQNLRQQAQVLQQQAMDFAQKSNLPITEAAQVAALVAANVYVTVNPQTIEQSWTPLKAAASLESAKTALNNFVQQLEVNHQQVVVDNLVLACHNATLKIGFTPLESSATMVNGIVRLIASDDTGRSLVTEIATNPDHPVQMATEIIGISDRSCDQILDAFEAALKEQGVIYAPPERKFTGGICELEAAKDFVRKRPTKKTQNQTTTSQPKAVHRPASQQQTPQKF
ncbi:hypothetical protein CDG77_28530 [Nostoc sp. 'Peltigera membranacea cyanobiont' 213]|uniref:hypothetical protein n=1 Tax=Nostoc sp. 'Peltigera membranacea cyanobiont' 213 TaxID=2014530 RepID=UPI000B953B67|nr:hypothetical protein [Nostoc sp. 'Peltigera membranacea cyanobiont' 213]OYD87587.1 hypothetical protein CDG77_28530 [Nostoc sp. 'Peltigera membranacea cyanobiont' 213]